ncbi:MAG: hypothetical protein EBZ94_05965 [Crocinitomicaceae bacterium]|jgi:hypothetical protein|nr:hypothetical protein [Crocinitomicaceae bacterium]NDC93257.1 hypothetical protein [Flavobacteriales bacterium]
MRTSYEIESLRFNNLDSTVELSVKVKEAQFTFSSSILMDMINLNLIINQLQKNNPEIEILDLLNVQSAENFNFYELNLTDLTDKSVDTEILNYQEKVIKQIRA